MREMNDQWCEKTLEFV